MPHRVSIVSQVNFFKLTILQNKEIIKLGDNSKCNIVHDQVEDTFLETQIPQINSLNGHNAPNLQIGGNKCHYGRLKLLVMHSQELHHFDARADFIDEFVVEQSRQNQPCNFDFVWDSQWHDSCFSELDQKQNWDSNLANSAQEHLWVNNFFVFAAWNLQIWMLLEEGFTLHAHREGQTEDVLAKLQLPE